MTCVKHLGILALVAALAACAPGPAKKESPSSRTPSRGTVDRGRPSQTPAKPARTQTPAAPKAADVKTRYKSALEQMRQGRLKEAEETLEQIVKESPDLSGPKTNLGIIYAKTNRRDDAISAFSKAAAANPGNVVAHNWLGTLYTEGKDYSRAEQSYLKALAADRDYPPALLNLGILYDLHLPQPQKALEYYKKYKTEADDSESLKLNVWIAALEEKLKPPSRKP